MTMHQGRQLTLRQMEIGQTGTVIGILGGRGLMRRLEALDIRPGKKVTKVSSTLFRGPVTLRVDNAQLAIGFGMANRIIVEVG
ncbi:MAG: ferrous iron transport protein A [Dehalococcoidia bacterium]|nr:ferrous iron transport protein A [Dehalococcoidia bacterium]